MKRLIISLILGWHLSCAVAAGEAQSLPWHILGSNFSDSKSQFLKIVYDRDYRDDYDNGKIDQRLLVIDTGRRYFTIHISDDVIAEVYISDELYVTERGIRIGDTLSEVRAAYPEAFRQVSGLDLYMGKFQVSESAGQVTFWFVNDDIKRRWRQGELIRWEDESIGRTKLRMMRIVPK